MKKLCTNRSILSALLLVAVLTTACSGTNGEDSVAPNKFSNGYRLSKITTDNFLFDQLDAAITYEYSEDSRTITRTSVRNSSNGDAEVFIRRLMLSSNGLLMQRETIQDEPFTVQYSYNSNGDLVKYSSPSKTQTISYENGNITEIRDNIDHTITFHYGANDRLESVKDSVTSVTTAFTYNNLNQIVTATETDQFSVIGFIYELAYDDVGNLIKMTTIRRFGDVYQEDVYEYEATDAPTYNHPMFRWVVQPYNNVVFNMGLQ